MPCTAATTRHRTEADSGAVPTAYPLEQRPRTDAGHFVTPLQQLLNTEYLIRPWGRAAGHGPTFSAVIDPARPSKPPGRYTTRQRQPTSSAERTCQNPGIVTVVGFPVDNHGPATTPCSTIDQPLLRSRHPRGPLERRRFADSLSVVLMASRAVSPERRPPRLPRPSCRRFVCRARTPPPKQHPRQQPAPRPSPNPQAQADHLIRETNPSVE